jgi:hypothetical protein
MGKLEKEGTEQKLLYFSWREITPEVSGMAGRERKE